jgi:tRNA-(ms[2]io[6]A)-hydroxylase
MGSYSLEESEHFKRVLDLMQLRGIPLKQDRKSIYVNHLRQFFSKSKDRTENLVNRLLIASMIEARSCERFSLFSKLTKDLELSIFYHALIKDEVGHYKLFLKLAKIFQDESIVTQKWNRFLIYEANFIKSLGTSALVHG